MCAILIIFLPCIVYSFAIVNGVENKIRFEQEPQNITVMEGHGEFIPCNILNTNAAPSWEIIFKNGTILTASSSVLPARHVFNGTGITLTDADVNLNETAYACYLIFAAEEGRNFSVLKSSTGFVTVIRSFTGLKTMKSYQSPIYHAAGISNIILLYISACMHAWL